ncbi:MAG: hypothetical protein ACYTHJ_16085 [Planctomycetota bacterium]
MSGFGNWCLAFMGAVILVSGWWSAQGEANTSTTSTGVCSLVDLVAGGPDCQSANGSLELPSDRHLPEPVTWRDDWCPLNSGKLSTICFVPCFFNPDRIMECDESKGLPVSEFELRLFEDIAGRPGPELGTAQTLTELVCERLGDAGHCWACTAEIAAVIVVNSESCYWLEISGAGEGAGGCTVFLRNSMDGNGYAQRCTSMGCEAILETASEPPDVAFCVDVGLDDPPQPAAACCQPDSTCTLASPPDCASGNGIFWAGSTCRDDPCPGPCEAESCEEAVSLNLPDESHGNTCHNGLPCSRSYGNYFCDARFSQTNCVLNRGGPMVVSDFGADVWYAYATSADECGILTISTCASQDWDGLLAVYDGGVDCECPADPSRPLACGDDTCGVEGGAAQVSIPVQADHCYLLRAGGWQGEQGEGVLDLMLRRSKKCNPAVPESPLADDRFNVAGDLKPCRSDDDCRQGEIGPGPETVCRTSAIGQGYCYVARQRYLSVRPHPGNRGVEYALRVALDTGVSGLAILGFVGQPQDVVSTGPGPEIFHLVRIGPRPFYADWTMLEHGIITIGDCEISPGHEYVVQGINLGSDPAVASNYSAPLLLPTPEFHGDVTAGGLIGGPPNGAPGSLVDVFAIILGFQNVQHEPRDWLDLQPNTGAAQPNLNVSLADAFAAIQAFQQECYPGPTPTRCP